jgi:hypothetical protein
MKALDAIVAKIFAYGPSQKPKAKPKKKRRRKKRLATESKA